jgi:acyl-CoA synthetase (AMP-forming)/AMP-acid ligase II
MPTCGFTQGYGLTETTGGVSAAPLRRHGEKDDRPGTVGQATANYEIRIVDPVTGKDVPAGTDGEVWLRGSQNAQGYWKRPEETSANFLPKGWFRTGDIGVLDDEGFLYLKDRLKDMIISGGENIYSVEVENALLTHPEIREVAVYGVPDERWGESVKAVVARTEGSTLDVQAVIAHARSRLARYKCPKIVEFVDVLPKSGSGKIIKHALRQRDSMRA